MCEVNLLWTNGIHRSLIKQIINVVVVYFKVWHKHCIAVILIHLQIKLWYIIFEAGCKCLYSLYHLDCTSLNLRCNIDWHSANPRNISYKIPFGGQFMLSTQLIILNYPIILSYWCSATVSSETCPLYSWTRLLAYKNYNCYFKPELAQLVLSANWPMSKIPRQEISINHDSNWHCCTYCNPCSHALSEESKTKNNCHHCALLKQK